MRVRLVRVDLSQEARDFQATAAEPGIPILDPGGVNAALLAGWLGRFAAEPEWTGGSVGFYLPDEAAEDREHVGFRPATPKRLLGPLRDELKQLQARLEQARPGSQMERVLHRAVLEEFRGLMADLNRAELGCYFLEYREARGGWRLVWCWGYKRSDRTAAVPAVCKRPDCKLLYAHREGKSGRCPRCYPHLADKKARPVRRGRRAVVMAVLLLLLLAAAAFLWQKYWPPAAAGKLVVRPDPLVVWVGGETTFDAVQVAPEDSGLPQSVRYRVAPVEEQHAFEVDVGKTLRGKGPGSGEVVVTAVDPDGPWDGLAANAAVEVAELRRIAIEPKKVSVRVGEMTPVLTVTGEGPGGVSAEVPATLESLDEDLLAPEATMPGRFVAKSLGAATVRASYLDRRATATVSVTGDRFLQVDTKLNADRETFQVLIDIRAAGSQGDLEYRVVPDGDTPPSEWVQAERQDDFQHATLLSPPTPYGPSSTRYRMVLEARDPADDSIDRYPFTFRFVAELERMDEEE